MAPPAETTCLMKSFERACRIEGRLTNIDWSAQHDAFEEEYEALLDEFYVHLLHIDSMIDNLFPTETQLLTCFKSFLETGRQLDDLWDRYHRDQLGRAQFSRLLGSVAPPQRGCGKHCLPIYPPNRAI